MDTHPLSPPERPVMTRKLVSIQSITKKLVLRAERKGDDTGKPLS
jgi:hypothetical protein